MVQPPLKPDEKAEIAPNIGHGTDETNGPSLLQTTLRKSSTSVKTHFSSNEVAKLFAMGAQWIWETDADHRFTYLSPSVYAHTGFHPEDIIGKSRRDHFFVGSAISADVMEHLEILERHLPFQDFIYLAKKPDDAEAWLCVSGAPRFDSHGQFAGYYGIGRALKDKSFQSDFMDLAADQLQQSEQLLGDVFASLSVGIIVFDQDSNFLICNPHLRNMYPEMQAVFQRGISLKQVLEHAYDMEMIDKRLSIAHEKACETRDQWVQYRLDAYRDEKFENIEFLEDGRTIHQAARHTPSGLWVSVRMDITKDRARDKQFEQAQEVADLANERLSAALKADPEGFAFWDRDQKLVMFNDAYAALVSENITLRIGQKFEELLHDICKFGVVPEAEGRKAEWIAEMVKRRKENPEIEDVYLNSQGRWILYRDVLAPNGERLDMRTDITDIKMRERDLAAALEQAHLSQDTINSIADPIFLKDEDLKYVLVNKAYAALHECEASSLIGKRAIDVSGPTIGANYEISDKEVLMSGKAYEIEIDHEENSGLARLVRKTRATGPSGKHYLVTCLFDVTEMRKREQELRIASERASLADRAKSEFLANMSHQIRTPMNGVLAMADILARDPLDSRQRTFVDIIQKSGRSLLGVINDILDVSQMENGRFGLKSVEFSFHEVVEDVARLMAFAAAEKDLDFIVDIDPSLQTELIGDPERLGQIIVNLVGNAIKFTEQGSVTLRVARTHFDDHETCLQIAVTDTGAGIDCTQHEAIFKQFSQGEMASSNHAGTGLGLAIVSKLVGLMGGACNLQSRVGIGSTFLVDIALQNSQRSSMSSDFENSLSGKNILIVCRSLTQSVEISGPLKAVKANYCHVENVTLALALCETMAQKKRSIDAIIILDEDKAKAALQNGLVSFGSRLEQKRPALIEAVALRDLAPRKIEPEIVGFQGRMTLPVRARELYKVLSSAMGLETGCTADIAIDSHTRLEPTISTTSNLPRVDVLIAEDNDVNQLIYAHILADSGLTYQIVSDGAAAIAAFEDNAPALILMDVDMPVKDGFEATKAIRSMQAQGGDQVPIIGIILPHGQYDHEMCLASGMSDHLPKPLSPEAVLSKIAQWSKRRLQKQA